MKRHYSDPTADQAIAHVDRELRRLEKYEERIRKNLEEKARREALRSTPVPRAEGPRPEEELTPEQRRRQAFLLLLDKAWPVPARYT